MIAKCLGAEMVFTGRDGAVAGGFEGVQKAVNIMTNEIDLILGQIGCPKFEELGPDFLWQEERGRSV